MEEKQENKNSLQKLANNPIFTIFLGFTTLVGTIWGFYSYYQSIKEAKPVYSVISDDLISDSKSNSKIKISYDSVAVDNVRLAKIALWNAGNTYLDTQDFLDSVHIKISPIRDARILEANITKISRNNLKHSLSISKDKSLIQLNILDKEVLEANDGFQLLIFYTSKANFVPEWKVDSRIKGIVSGFENMNTLNIISFFDYNFDYYTLVHFIGIILMLLFYYFYSTSKFNNNLILNLTTLFLLIAFYLTINEITKPISDLIPEFLK